MTVLPMSRKFWKDIRQRLWVKCSKLEGTWYLLVQIALCVPLPSELRMLLSSVYRENTSHMRVLSPASENVRNSFLDFMTCFRGRSEVPSCTCQFSNSFTLKYLICQNSIIGVAIPEPHQTESQFCGHPKVVHELLSSWSPTSPISWKYIGYVIDLCRKSVVLTLNN